jgi:hypothetical protein
MSTNMTKDRPTVRDHVRRPVGDGRSGNPTSADPRPKRNASARRGNRGDATPRPSRRESPKRANEPPVASTEPDAKQAERARRRRGPRWLTWYLESQTLEKSLTLSGFVAALIMILPFGCDLVCGWPFYHASTLFDVSSVAGGLGLAFLTWDALRDFH